MRVQPLIICFESPLQGYTFCVLIVLLNLIVCVLNVCVCVLIACVLIVRVLNIRKILYPFF